MNVITEVLGVAFVGIGMFFSVVGVLGFVRMPDVYTRLHATGKVSTVGLLGLLIGAAFLLPEVTFKVAAMAIFAVLTLPVSTHAIAAAAYRHGVKMLTGKAERDDLAQHLSASNGQVSETP